MSVSRRTVAAFALRPVLLLAVVTMPFAGVSGQEKKPPAHAGEVVPEMSKDLMSVFQDRAGNYWFGSNTHGVYRYDGKAVTQFTTKHGLCSDRIRGIQQDQAGNVYVTTYEGINKFDGKSFTTLTSRSGSAWKNEPGDLWFVGAPDTGAVYRYDGEVLHRLTLPKTRIGEEVAARYPRSAFPNAIFSPYDVYTITTDRRGHVWFGTAAAGACRFDGESFAWLHETHLTETPAGGSFGIRSIHEDKSGAFWICNTRYRYRLDAKALPKPATDPIPYRREQGTGPLKTPRGDDHVYFFSVVEDKHGVLWLATYESGVWRYDGVTATRFPVLDGLKEVSVFTVTQDNRGDLWLGTHEAGAYKFNGKTFEKFRP